MPALIVELAAVAEGSEPETTSHESKRQRTQLPNPSDETLKAEPRPKTLPVAKAVLRKAMEDFFREKNDLRDIRLPDLRRALEARLHLAPGILDDFRKETKDCFEATCKAADPRSDQEDP